MQSRLLPCQGAGPSLSTHFPMRLPILATLIGLTPLWAQETEPDTAVVELRATIGKIVDAETQRSREVADWEARKQEMGMLLEVHRKELELLTEELDKAGASAGGFDERKQAAEADLAKLKEARRVVKEAVVKAKPRALALAKRLPAPLKEEVEVDRQILEAWTAEAEAREGLQAILAIVANAERFNRRITRTEEERDGREVEVLYLGLARAYYADRSGHAGVGVPGKDGWEWTANPALSGELRNAFSQLDRKLPPKVVNLPVQIQEEGGAK